MKKKNLCKKKYAEVCKAKLRKPFTSMRDAFKTFSIRVDTDQQLLLELPDQGLLCLIIKKGYNIVDMTSILLGKCTNVKFYYCHNFGKVEEAY